jgi:hypothetical protein
MDENHQDKTTIKLIATENKSQLSPLSRKDREIDQKDEKRAQKELAHLRKDRKEVKKNLTVGAFLIVEVIVVIYIWVWLNLLLWVLYLLLTMFGILFLILLIQVGYTAQWTGLKGKTLWDWLNLLGTLAIPIVVVLATIGFGWWQGQGALDQQRTTTLQTYIDNMQDLILTYNLLGESSKLNNSSDAARIYEAQQLARARTLTALQGLDPVRKGRLLTFLYEAKLIGFMDTNGKIHNPIIKLTGADLRGADLYSISPFLINLRGVYLDSADLSSVDLSGADFCGAKLREADLDSADLSGADFCRVDLRNAHNLTQKQLDQVDTCKDAKLPQGLTCHHNQ